MTHAPFVLIVLDGWGYRDSEKDNAIAEADTPFFDRAMTEYPHSLLAASESAVGLPPGFTGNSEVGHMTIGTGRITDLDLVRINKDIASGTFAKNPALVKLFAHVTTHDSTLHIYGLVSPGGIHTHEDHLFAILRAAKAAGITKVAVHAFMDGRDVSPTSGAASLRKLQSVIEETGIGRIATISGRFYAMDRDKRWERIEKAEAAVMRGEGVMSPGQTPPEALEALYREGVSDEHVVPMVFPDANGAVATLEPHDGVVFFNFRADRARELSQKVLEKKGAMDLCFVTMTEYEKHFDALVAYPSLPFETTLAAEIAKAGLRQVHIAETEKYAHVTYFFNGGREDPYENERRVLVDSRRDVPTYDLAPEMRAKEITDKAIEEVEKAEADFIIMNYANPDMVGHTAVKASILKAIEVIDREVGRLVAIVLAKGGIVMITADHGNAEMNVDPSTGERHTAHTTNPVPCIVTRKDIVLRDGSLMDVAPTILELMNLPKPAAMTGTSLIVR